MFERDKNKMDLEELPEMERDKTNNLQGEELTKINNPFDKTSENKSYEFSGENLNNTSFGQVENQNVNGGFHTQQVENKNFFS